MPRPRRAARFFCLFVFFGGGGSFFSFFVFSLHFLSTRSLNNNNNKNHKMNPTTDERSGKTERWNVQMKKKTKKTKDEHGARSASAQHFGTVHKEQKKTSDFFDCLFVRW